VTSVFPDTKCQALTLTLRVSPAGPVQAGRQALDEGDGHQLTPGLVRDDDGIIEQVIVPVSNGVRKNVPDAVQGLSPCRFEIGKLNTLGSSMS
jgi:hypothetical protein